MSTSLDRVLDVVRADPSLLEKTEEQPEWVTFTYYLHDNSDSGRFDAIEESAGFVLSEELRQKIGRPFYEVTLHCRLNTRTGTVELTEAVL